MHLLPGSRQMATLRTRCAVIGFAAALGALTGAPAYADITIPAGGTLALDAGGLDAACTDLIVAGTLHTNSAAITNVRNVIIASGGVIDAQSSTIAVAGDWSNAGTFSPGASTVTFTDGCGVTNATITGNTTFNNVNFLTSTGKQWTFAAGSTQTVQGAIVITGTGPALRFRSTVPGVDAFIRPQGTLTRTNLDNINVVFGPPRPPSGAPTPVPTLSTIATLLLALLLFAVSGRALPTRATRRRTTLDRTLP
jgi:hypothetical protein